MDLTVRLAREFGVKCLILCDTAHVFQKEGAETLTVSKGADSVDFALVNRVEPGDIAVTQDYGLAAMCLAKRALPLSQDGLLYTEENIGTLLQSRYAAQKIRRSGGRLKGPKKRTSEQDAAFERTLRRLLQLR